MRILEERFRLRWLFGAALAVVGFLTTACSESDPERAAFRDSGCPRCHGADFGGTKLGPPLTDLSNHWDTAGLKRFLALPDSVRAADKRLSRLAERYPSPMPTFVMSDSLRSTLAAYLLNPIERR
jgi:hypothetical protein